MTTTDTDTIVSTQRADSSVRPRRMMTGDRFCSKCGYNLVGQEIVREGQYGLLIVRCPECATVTALQEYPLLGAWGARWGALLAGLWLIFLLAAWPATSGALLGFGLSILDEGSYTYGRYLADLQAADDTASPAAPTPPGQQTMSTRIPPRQLLNGSVTIQGTTIFLGGPDPQFTTWWESQDHAAVLAAAGGWLGAFDHVDLLLLVPAAAVAFVLGCFWSVFLMQVPRRRLLFCGLAIVGLACLLAMIPVMDLSTRAASSARRAAQYQLAVPTLVLYFSIVTVPLLIGLRFGRSMARLAVSALLPPKLRGPLALLWNENSPAG